MKIQRRRGIGKIKIHHNKKLFWIIIGLIILLVIIICNINTKKQYYVLENNECVKIYEYPDKITFSHYVKLEDCVRMIIGKCNVDSDCVPASCCHAESCVAVNEAPNCSGIFCSQVCSSPLDCNAGYCGCVKGNCEVIER